MHEPHPNLSDDINNKIADSELLGGVWIRKPTGEAVKDEPYLPIGRTLKVQTKNTLYTIENREDGTHIQGHRKYCPVMTKCAIHGSSWGGSMLKIGWIGVGMHLEFGISDYHQTIVTSEIQDVQEVK